MKFSQRKDRAERPLTGDVVVYVSAGVIFLCFTYAAVAAIELFF